jgi:K+-transporting ATPase A subunit
MDTISICVTIIILVLIANIFKVRVEKIKKEERLTAIALLKDVQQNIFQNMGKFDTDTMNDVMDLLDKIMQLTEENIF